MDEINKIFDRNGLIDLISEFGSINRKAEGLALILKKELFESDNDHPQLKLSTYVRLSKWCNTNTPYSGIHKRGGSLTVFMSVPETTVDEDYGSIFWKNNIGFAGVAFIIYSIPESV